MNFIISCTTSGNNEEKSSNKVFQNKNFDNDSITCQDINVCTFKIGASKENVENFLGKPDSIKKRIDTEDSPDFQYDVLIYNDSEFYFYKGLLFGFMLNNPKFTFNKVRSVNPFFRMFLAINFA